MWPYIVGYFVIGLVLSCLVQYFKGRTTQPRTYDLVRDMNFDFLSAAVLAVWPGVIGLCVCVAVMMAIALPVIKLSGFCANLGKKHRGTNELQ